MTHQYDSSTTGEGRKALLPYVTKRFGCVKSSMLEYYLFAARMLHDAMSKRKKKWKRKEEKRVSGYVSYCVSVCNGTQYVLAKRYQTVDADRADGGSGEYIGNFALCLFSYLSYKLGDIVHDTINNNPAVCRF